MNEDTSEVPTGDTAESRGTSGRQVQGIPSFLREVPVEVTVEVGRARLEMAGLLELGEGVVVELDDSVGQPARLLAAGKPVALVELVTVDDQLAARIVKVLDAEETA